MKLAASVVSLEVNRALLRALDEWEWLVDIRDLPPDLARENQTVYLDHNADGYVKEITERIPYTLPTELQERIDEVRKWVDTL